MLGLFAFFYATLHMLTWVVFVHYFDTSFMVEDVAEAITPLRTGSAIRDEALKKRLLLAIRAAI